MDSSDKGSLNRRQHRSKLVRVSEESDGERDSSPPEDSLFSGLQQIPGALQPTEEQLQRQELQSQELQSQELQSQELQSQKLQSQVHQSQELQSQKLQSQIHQSQELQSRELQSHELQSQKLQSQVHQSQELQSRELQSYEHQSQEPQRQDLQSHELQSQGPERQQPQNHQCQNQRHHGQQLENQQHQIQQLQCLQLQNQELQNQVLQNQELQNQELQNQELQNQALHNHESQNQPLLNQQLQNLQLQNLQLQNLQLRNQQQQNQQHQTHQQHNLHHQDLQNPSNQYRQSQGRKQQHQNQRNSQRRQKEEHLQNQSPPAQVVVSMSPVGGEMMGTPRRVRQLSLSCLANSILTVEKGKKTPQVCGQERKLLHAAEVGDCETIERLLRRSDVTASCTDLMGRTPIQLAVANDHLEAVSKLLSHSEPRCILEALFLAIRTENDEMAEAILKHKRSAEAIPRSDSSPLVLAARLSRYEVVMALLMKGYSIERPHQFNCPCLECHGEWTADELKFAKSRLNAYRGLASPAYLALASKDPILASFQLRHELGQVANNEKYFTAEYHELSEQLADFVVELLDKVEGNDELNVLLNSVEDGPPQKLARLQLAIDYQEKKFVAHPSCQKKLSTLWYDGFVWLRQRSTGVRILVMILIVLTFPILAGIYLFLPPNRIHQIVRTPVVKFVVETSSFIVFMFLILGNSVTSPERLCQKKLSQFGELAVNLRHLGLDKFVSGDTDCVRNFSTPGVQRALAVWVLALLWHECRQLYADGAIQHFSSVYNYMDFFMLKFYLAAIAAKFVANQRTWRAVQLFSSWKKLSDRSCFTERECFLEDAYWLIADRFYWSAWDPMNLCESLYCVANVLTFARLFYLLAINENLGPMLISLEKMIKDVMKFMVTFLLILVAFMVGLYNLYWYYEPSVQSSVSHEPHPEPRAAAAFGTPEFTFRTVLWAVFGLTDVRVVQLGLGFQSWLTERVGYIVFGVYNWAAVIVLLNMLIAMMTRSFEKIAREQDAEWKFARARLYIEYIKHGSTLPVPFNLFPPPKKLVRVLLSLLGFIPKTPPDDPDALHADQGTSRKIVEKVVRRFILENLQDSANPSEGDLDHLKHGLSSLREDFRKSDASLQAIESAQRNLSSILEQLSQSIHLISGAANRL